MKTFLTAISVFAFLCFASGASLAGPFLQGSSTEMQLATDTKPQVVTMNATDAAKGLTNENGKITISEDGTYFVMAAAQVGGKAEGAVRLWLRANSEDVANTNTEQTIPNPSFTAVLVSQGLATLKKGDKLEVVYSGSAPDLGLIVKTPKGEPVVPSIIFSVYKID
jgi:hypothetical protein